MQKLHRAIYFFLTSSLQRAVQGRCCPKPEFSVAFSSGFLSTLGCGFMTPSLGSHHFQIFKIILRKIFKWSSALLQVSLSTALGYFQTYFYKNQGPVYLPIHLCMESDTSPQDSDVGFCWLETQSSSLKGNSRCHFPPPSRDYPYLHHHCQNWVLWAFISICQTMLVPPYIFSFDHSTVLWDQQF